MKECKNCNRNNCCALALTCIPYDYKYWEEKLSKTILGTIIPPNTKGIVYLCEFTESELVIQVTHEILCDTQFRALDYYANIPNPESQIVMGKTYEELCTNLEMLHKNMKDKEWLKNLAETL